MEWLMYGKWRFLVSVSLLTTAFPPSPSPMIPQMEECDDGQAQRPEVREEDLLEAKDQLGQRKEVKSKTYEVMEECGE